ALDLENGVTWRLQFSVAEAARWRDFVRAQLEILESDPIIHPHADEWEEGGPDLRQAIIGKIKNRYRVVFEIRVRRFGFITFGIHRAGRLIRRVKRGVSA